MTESTQAPEGPKKLADMDQDAELKRFLSYVNAVKTDVVNNMDPDVPQSDDIPPVVRMIRTSGTHGVEVVAWAPRMDRDLAMRIIEMLTVMSPDIITLACDAHVTREMTNPVTGEKWGPGEMQNLCDNEGACSTGLLTDCITASTVDKTGRVQMHNFLYEVDKATKTIAWLPADESRALDTDDAEGKLEGLILDFLREMITYEHPMLSVSKVVGDGMGLGGLEQQARILCAIVGILLQQGVVCMIRTDSEEATQFYQGIQSRYENNDPDEQMSETMEAAVSEAAELVKQELARREAEKEKADA